MIAASCGPTVYRDTWRPATSQDTWPMLLESALAVDPEDVVELAKAKPQFLGYHATGRGFGVRAASVGGTHFFAAKEAATSDTHCVVWSGGHSTCTATAGSKATKIAVVRVEPRDWDKLPPHLVPPVSDTTEEVAATASLARYGCDVSPGRGSVHCANNWKLLKPADAPTFEQCKEKASLLEVRSACGPLDVTYWNGR